MSNLLFNIRFGCWFLQITDSYDFSWTYSDYHEKERQFDPDWEWFALYCAFGKSI